jgi:hypothetical protein
VAATIPSEFEIVDIILSSIVDSSLEGVDDVSVLG